MVGLEFARAYIDELLVLVTKGNFDTHLEHLEQVLTRLAEAGLKINASKSYFRGDEPLEYLGYLVNREGVRPTIKKVSAILKIAIPTTKKQLRSFIGMVDYYRDMAVAPVLTPLSSINRPNLC
jgi:hypothetical protein